MRIPIILMLLTVLTLPADLDGFAHDIQSGVQTVATTAAKFLHREDDGVQVAEAAPKAVPGAKVTKVQ